MSGSRDDQGARVADHERTLRCLAVNDERLIGAVLSGHHGSDASGFDPKTRALVRLASLVALDAAPATYQCETEAALAAGATVDDIVGTLIAVAPLIGVARAVSAAPKLGIAVGYDVDAALERLEREATTVGVDPS